ncbi:hypothetical protein Dvina_46755 [Dactylosporangium vinaceum]|uniref:Uncharacterized protein n=1 Tax=Dactylosporangium vinaceum TaxID=53362 RepID=A0ABV5M7P8_9ACTN|nr:hypothetical protein [Dactylosporangium vinaceum]UAB95443.1 hypothetical protein Dvina_46755 [Dactylosporangium vinaceum]
MSDDSLLHRLTHQVPGVPEHRENRPHTNPHTKSPGTNDHHTDDRRAHSRHAHNQRVHNQPARSHHHGHDRPPRILVAWQRRIAALFGQSRRKPQNRHTELPQIGMSNI